MRDTYGLFILAHLLPNVRDHVEKLSIGELGMLVLELLANLVLKEDVGRRGAFRRVGVLWFRVALAFFGSLVIVESDVGLAFMLEKDENDE